MVFLLLFMGCTCPPARGKGVQRELARPIASLDRLIVSFDGRDGFVHKHLLAIWDTLPPDRAPFENNKGNGFAMASGDLAGRVRRQLLSDVRHYDIGLALDGVLHNVESERLTVRRRWRDVPVVRGVPSLEPGASMVSKMEAAWDTYGFLSGPPRLLVVEVADRRWRDDSGQDRLGYDARLLYEGVGRDGLLVLEASFKSPNGLPMHLGWQTADRSFVEQTALRRVGVHPADR